MCTDDDFVWFMLQSAIIVVNVLSLFEVLSPLRMLIMSEIEVHVISDTEFGILN